MYYVGLTPYDPNYLEHYGTKGMRWGERHWQYSDGRFNEAGKLRYFGTPSQRKASAKTKTSGSSSIRKNKSTSSESSKKTRVSSDKTNNKEKFWTDERKATAKKAAIIAGVVAASVVAYKIAKPQLMEVEAGANFMTTRYATKMSKTPISKLSDDDTIIKSGTEIQRIIRDYHNPNKALNMDAAKKFIYGATDEHDKQIYRALFRSKGQGKDMITSRVAIKDIRMPSPQKRIQTFVDSFNERSFAEAFANDMKSIGQLGANKKLTADDFMSMSSSQRQAYYSRFNMFAGDSRSKSAKMYFDAIRDRGYTALIDDNDGGFLSKAPTIFLDANEDTVVVGKRYASSMEKYLDGVNLKHIYGRSALH